jgi:hypothetical protein
VWEANCHDLRRSLPTSLAKILGIVDQLMWHVPCYLNLLNHLGGRMLWTCFVTLLFLWCVALVASVTLNGFIHVLPFVAAVVALVGTIQGRNLI